MHIYKTIYISSTDRRLLFYLYLFKVLRLVFATRPLSIDPLNRRGEENILLLACQQPINDDQCADNPYQPILSNPINMVQIH